MSKSNHQGEGEDALIISDYPQLAEFRFVLKRTRLEMLRSVLKYSLEHQHTVLLLR